MQGQMWVFGCCEFLLDLLLGPQLSEFSVLLGPFHMPSRGCHKLWITNSSKQGPKDKVLTVNDISLHQSPSEETQRSTPSGHLQK